MTVHESWAIAGPEVKKLDEGARLTLVTSGLDIDHRGGPTDLKLESRLLGSGEAVWVTYFRDAEVQVAFS